MTISEQLQFSVLTAPVATVDRRALSQAWYSALYGNQNATSQVEGKGIAPHASQQKAPNVQPGASAARASEPLSIAPAARESHVRRAEGPQIDRRAPRSVLARKIEQTFLRPRGRAHKASFTVEGEQGRVHVVLQTRGTRFKLVAICPPKERANVAAALLQARYALALRGIDLDAQTRGAEAC